MEALDESDDSMTPLFEIEEKMTVGTLGGCFVAVTGS